MKVTKYNPSPKEQLENWGKAFKSAKKLKGAGYPKYSKEQSERVRKELEDALKPYST